MANIAPTERPPSAKSEPKLTPKPQAQKDPGPTDQAKALVAAAEAGSAFCEDCEEEKNAA